MSRHWCNPHEWECEDCQEETDAQEVTHTVSDATLRQIRTALAAMLCANEEHCPTLREARLLCVEAMRLINTELNTKNADAFKPTE